MIWSQFTLYEFSPRGQDSISPVPHDDCSGTISGDKDSTLKITIKVPMNLIRQKSPLEMCLLDASPVCTVVKYGPRVESTLPLPEERLFAAAITWQTSTRTETMDSEHNEGYVWNFPSFKKPQIQQCCLKTGQYKWESKCCKVHFTFTGTDTSSKFIFFTLNNPYLICSFLSLSFSELKWWFNICLFRTNSDGSKHFESLFKIKIQSALGNRTFIFILKIPIIEKYFFSWMSEMNYTSCKTDSESSDAACTLLIILPETASVHEGLERRHQNSEHGLSNFHLLQVTQEVYSDTKFLTRLSVLWEHIGGVRIQSFKSFPLWFS